MIEFKIPSLPMSVNSLYRINIAHRVVYLSAEGRAFKQQVKTYMPPMTYPIETRFHLSMYFHGEWKYKNGKNKRADVQNLVKILIDAIFEKIGHDDSWVYSLCAYKIEDIDIYTLVKIDVLA